MKPILKNLAKFHVSPEMSLLLNCCVFTPQVDTSANEISIQIPKDIDWGLLFRNGAYHKLLPQLFSYLEVLKIPGIPEEMLSELEGTVFQNSVRNLHMAGVLCDVVSVMRDNGIEALPFKGPVLSKRVYSEINCRFFNDLDILVSVEDALKARDILVENGFEVTPSISKDCEQAYMADENFFVLTHTEKKVDIDLHWELTGRYSLIPLEFEDLRDSFLNEDFAGVPMHSLSDEDSLVQICVHATSHCWDKLEAVCCIAHHLKNNECFCWESVLERATSINCLRMVLLGLQLSRLIYKTRFPSKVLELLGEDKGVQDIAQQITRNLLQNTSRNINRRYSWRFSLLHLRIRDSFADRVQYCLRMLFRPTIQEWIFCSLPSSLSFLHVIIRPFRLGWVAVQSTFENVAKDKQSSELERRFNM